MFIILIAAWGIFFFIRYGQEAGVTRAALDATVCFGLCTVLICELLSLPAWYTRPAVLTCWLLLCAAACALLNKPLRAGLRNGLAFRPGRTAWYAWVGGAVVGACLLGTLLSALLYPPMNYDSIAYHMTRVFFWMKNASVHNYPTQMARQLFTGPLSGYFLLQAQVLDGGSDRLANLSQWLAYAGSILAATGIAKEFGAGSKGRWLTAVLAATTQMSILQASSTQNDLMLAFFCLMAGYYVVLFAKSPPATRGARLWWAVCAGGTAGLTLLTKLNALAVLGPLALLAFGLMCGRLAWRDIRALVVPALICALLLGVGVFARNAAEHEGDPLALQSSGGNILLKPLEKPAQWAMLGVDAFAGSLGGWPFNAANRLVERGAEAIGGLLGVPPDDPAIAPVGFSTSLDLQSHDSRTYPLHSAWVYATILASLCHALFRRKGRNFRAAYALALAAAFVVTALTKRWSTSEARYLLPMALLGLPLIPGVWGGRRLPRILSCCAVGVATLLGAVSLLFNVFQPLARYPGTEASGRYVYSYDNMRAVSMGSEPAELAALNARLRESGATRVGIDLNRRSYAIYPLLYPLRDSAYDVRGINASYLADREDPDFAPQAILTTGRKKRAPKTLSYHDVEYRLETRCDASVGAVSLYLKAED